jgi:hypothetical protein
MVSALTRTRRENSSAKTEPARVRLETAKSSLKSEYEVQGFIRRLVNLIETFATSSSAGQNFGFSVGQLE